MPEQQGEKSQEPTQHRRQQAREEGSVAKSQDLGSAVLLLVGVVAVLTLGDSAASYMARLMASRLGGPAWLRADVPFVVFEWNGLMFDLARHLLPVLGLMVLAAIVVNLGQVGFVFLPEKLAPDLTRLDPLQGLQRMFSMTNVARLAFGLFKLAVVGGVAALVLYQERDVILSLAEKSLPAIAVYLSEVLLWTTIKIGAALLILALLDYGFQWWKHEQDLKMTPQEVREEMRNLEGDPQVISRRKAVQRQLAMRRLSDAVPKADVVVTNPTELAVAIQYDPETMAAPIVVAKGAGVLASRIRRLALEHGIPVVERKPLAQALYREVEISQPVPQDKFAAVAEVLAYVYHLKGKKLPTGKQPW
jgi:flagellar biosynthetic protein FlhB